DDQAFNYWLDAAARIRAGGARIAAAGLLAGRQVPERHENLLGRRPLDRGSAPHRLLGGGEQVPDFFVQPRRRRNDLLGQLLRGGAASIAIHLLQRLRQRRRLLAVGAEGDDDDLANRRGGRLRAFVREERILDHRHHAFRPRRDEPGELRVEEPVGGLDAVESRLVEQLRDVAGGVVLEVQV